MLLNSSRNSMHSVMANSGFGPLLIIKGSTIIELPRTAMKLQGTCQKKFQKLITGNLTAEKQTNLQKLGAVITLKKQEVA